MRAAERCLPLALAARVDKPWKEEAAGLDGTYGESVRPWASGMEFGADGRSKRAGLRACDDMTGSRAEGLLPVELDGFAVLSVMWRKPMPSRNAVSFRVSFGRCDGHLVMRPAPLVEHGIWASGRGGRSR